VGQEFMVGRICGKGGFEFGAMAAELIGQGG